MKSEYLSHIIDEGESQIVEFKQSFSKAVIEALVAFANTNGGRVILGVKNNGEVCGVKVLEESIQNWLNEIKQKTEPSIMPDVDSVDIQGKQVLVFAVQEYPIKPIAFQGRYFHRKLNSTHQMSVTEVANLHMLTMQYSWDAFPYPNATLDDLNLEKVSDFIGKVNNVGRFRLENDNVRALNKLNFLKDDVPTNAAMILFSKKNLFYNVHIGRFKTPTHIIADTMVNGNLYDVIDKSMEVILSHLKFAFEITGE